MKLELDLSIASNYKSNSQRAKVSTESWVLNNSYCPNCGKEYLNKYEANRPVADFYCVICKEDYELKSKSGLLGLKILDGAYKTMIQRITSETNPNFFFLTYNPSSWSVRNFLIIPKHFFVPEIIVKRKPLAITARRKGWVGCNIDLSEVPSVGRIFIIKESKTLNRKEVLQNWKDTLFLKSSSIETKGWLLDTLNCLDKISSKQFTLSDMYKFETTLKAKHPNNNFIKDKIRQQLQLLRDKGLIEFVGKGKYMKTK